MDHTHSNRPQSLWEVAVKSLSEADRAQLVLEDRSPSQILQDILVIAETKKRICLEKRWKYTKNGQDVIIRDKLEKIVTWVNRLKEVGNTIVQYDPTHAALPWAGVLLVLQIATGDVHTFGAMVDGIEIVAHLLVRYSVLEKMYTGKEAAPSPAVVQLLVALTKLYISMLRYLVKAQRFFSASTTKRILKSSLSTPEVQVQQQLDVISKKVASVDSCLSIVRSEEQMNMQSEISDALSLVRELQKPMIRTVAQLSDLHDYLTRKARKEALAWLSQVPVHSHHRSAGEGHLPGSGVWLLKRPEFDNWRRSSSSEILWVHGIEGCGKTKLAYKAIRQFLDDHATSKAAPAPAPAPVAFFYCARNPAEPHRSDPSEVIRSLLRQIATTAGGTLRGPVLRVFNERKKSVEEDGFAPELLTISEARDVILEIFETVPATIVVDALDECDPGRRHELFSVLEQLLKGSASVVKVLLTSRNDGDICGWLENHPSVYIRTESNREDIHRYIDQEISNALASRRLLNGNMSESLRHTISDTLKEKSEGMFRWVSMQMDNLCDSRRLKIEGDVRQEVGRLPRGLRASYDKNYNRISDLAHASRCIAERVFKWLLCAHKLLTADHLAAAVTFASEHHVLDEKSLLDICCNFVVVDDCGYFRFAHLSVREYFESLGRYSLSECHAAVLERCLESCIHTTDNWNQLLHGDTHLVMRRYAMLHWPLHCQEATTASPVGHSARIMAQDFILKRGDLVGTDELETAFPDWVADIWSASQYSDGLECDASLLQRLESTASPSASPFFLACTFDLHWMLEEVALRGFEAWGSRNYRGETCFETAVRWNNPKCVAWMLQRPVVVKESGSAALSLALELNHLDSAQLLTQHGADGFSGDDNTCVLRRATTRGLANIVRSILSSRDQFQARSFAISMCVAHEQQRDTLFPVFWETCTALPCRDYFRVVLVVQEAHQVAQEGNDSYESLEELLAKLMVFSRENESLDSHKVYELFRILGERFEGLRFHRGCVVVVTGLGLNLTSNCRSTFEVEVGIGLLFDRDPQTLEALELLVALGVADLGPDEKFLRDLLGLKVRDKLLSEDSETWIMFLIAREDMSYSEESRELGLRLFTALLDVCGDVDTTDNKGRTLLMLVTRWDDPRCIQRLLAKGADASKKDLKGQSALFHAIKNGAEEAMTALLDANPDNTGIMDDLEKVLQVSCQSCLHDTISLLRSHGVRRPRSTLVRGVYSVPFLPTTACHRCMCALLAPGPAQQDSQTGIEQVMGTLVARSRLDPFAGSSSGSEAGESESETGMGRNGHGPDIDWGPSSLLGARSWEDGLTPLQAAVSLEDETAVVSIVQGGADVNAVDHYGFSALHYATVCPSLAIVDILLNHGADPRQRDSHGRTALQLAIACMESSGWTTSSISLRAIRRLLEVMDQQDVDSQDIDGNTALHTAILTGNLDVASVLYFDAHASLDVENRDGRTPGNMGIDILELTGLQPGLDPFGDLAGEWEDGMPLLEQPGGSRPDDDDDDDKGGSEPQARPIDAKKEMEKGLVLGSTEANYSPHWKKWRAGVDIFNGYGTTEWTSLSGAEIQSLRPLDAKYFARS